MNIKIGSNYINQQEYKNSHTQISQVICCVMVYSVFQAILPRCNFLYRRSLMDLSVVSWNTAYLKWDVLSGREHLLVLSGRL